MSGIGTFGYVVAEGGKPRNVLFYSNASENGQIDILNAIIQEINNLSPPLEIKKNEILNIIDTKGNLYKTIEVFQGKYGHGKKQIDQQNLILSTIDNYKQGITTRIIQINFDDVTTDGFTIDPILVKQWLENPTNNVSPKKENEEILMKIGFFDAIF